MKKLLLLISITVITMTLTGCFAGTGKVGLGEEFELKIGESAAIKDEAFEITFLEVLEDSRCPKNVTCIWEGRARSLIRIKTGGQTDDIELIEPGLTGELNSHSYGGYRITYNLLPYPENAGESLAGKYYLKLTVSR